MEQKQPEQVPASQVSLCHKPVANPQKMPEHAVWSLCVSVLLTGFFVWQQEAHAMSHKHPEQQEEVITATRQEVSVCCVGFLGPCLDPWCHLLVTALLSQ